MRQKLHDMAVTVATPLFGPGERAEATGRARVGRVSLARNAALAAASLLLSGGTVGMYQQKKSFYILLTNQRLLVLEPHWLTGRPTTQIVGEVPRQALAIAEAKRGFMATVTLAIAGEGQGLRLSYPAMDKEGADNLLRALQYTAV
ncbi:hypothetical protein ABT297_36555 [Dactylosporangium sp. NPDC000555]|uniref:hypothetical protein n=1 Tax=Dactylosporangium sp. NPDC000555 TaxID=3154260 RepID=UPI0033261D75